VATVGTVLLVTGVGRGQGRVSGVFLDADDIRAHGRDERIGVRQYDAGVEFTSRFMKALAAR
jgi:acetylornithine deacetylase/succinyl-diaminopimelate desuccinylase-like protein